MRAIVNADDLGYSASTNAAIFRLMDKGAITSATAMVAAPAFERAVRDASAYDGCSFGVHLNLTEFASLTNAAVFHELGVVDCDGRFTGNIRDVTPSMSLKAAIFCEWSQQIQTAIDCGLPVSHLDSHHHVHTIPWLFGTLRRLVLRYRIKKVRKSLNWYYLPQKRPSKALLLRKQLWNAALRHMCGVRTTDYFTSFVWFMRNVADGDDRAGTVELMTHPGQPDLREEAEMLQPGWTREVPGAVELISYSDL